MKLWSQLGFHAESESPISDNGHPKGNIVISLTLSPFHGVNGEEHNTDQSEVLANVHPPAGVPVVTLDTIDLLLMLSNRPTSTLNVAASDYRRFLECQKKRWHIQNHDRLRRRGLSNNVSNDIVQTLHEALEKGAMSTPTSILSRNHIPLSGNESASQICSQGHVIWETCARGSTISSQKIKPSSDERMDILQGSISFPQVTVRDALSSFPQLSFEDFVTLLDASLRETLFGHGTPSTDCTIGISNDEHLNLCQLSPSLLCPGYLKVGPRLSKALSL